MIRKKEDLYNTYIRNDKGELRYLYLKVCSEFGLHTFSGGFDAHFYDTELIQCDEYSMPDSEGILQRAVEVNGDFVELTIDDLRLKTPLLQTGEDFEHTKTLNFIRDRLVEVHGEPENLDYMHKLNNAIAFVERIEEAKISNDGFEPVDIESKPKRTKVELKANDYPSVSSAIKAHEDGVKFVRIFPVGDSQVLSWFELCECFANGWRIKIEVETEITEREEFIGAAMEIAKREGTEDDRVWLGDIFNELISN